MVFESRPSDTGVSSSSMLQFCSLVAVESFMMTVRSIVGDIVGNLVCLKKET